MKDIISISNTARYVVQADHPEVGWYLYVFQGEKCIGDYLQDTKEACMELAKDQFGVAIDSWRQAEENI